MLIDKSWKLLLKQYYSPTILKENLLKPYFYTEKLPNPVLDIGCGTGYFCELLSSESNHVIGVDIHKQVPKNMHFEYHTMDGANLKFKSKTFGSVLLINVLSCIDSEKKRIKILSEANRVKKDNAKIYLVSMNEELIQKPFNDDLLITKKIDDNRILLSFKKKDGNRIDIIDNVIANDDLNLYFKKAGLKIVKEISFKYKNREIYHLIILN